MFDLCISATTDCNAQTEQLDTKPEYGSNLSLATLKQNQSTSWMSKSEFCIYFLMRRKVSLMNEENRLWPSNTRLLLKPQINSNMVLSEVS